MLQLLTFGNCYEVACDFADHIEPVEVREIAIWLRRGYSLGESQNAVLIC
jgi:hypothetical protein